MFTPIPGIILRLFYFFWAPDVPNPEDRRRLIEAAETVAAFYTAMLEQAEWLLAELPDGIARDAVEEEIARIRKHYDHAIRIHSQWNEEPI